MTSLEVFNLHYFSAECRCNRSAQKRPHCCSFLRPGVGPLFGRPWLAVYRTLVFVCTRLCPKADIDVWLTASFARRRASKPSFSVPN